MSWKGNNVYNRMRPLLAGFDPYNGYTIDVGTAEGVFTKLIMERPSTVIQTDIRYFIPVSDLFFLGTVTALPIRRKSITTILCAQVLHYIPSSSLKSVIIHLLSLLSENGRLILIEYVNGAKYPWVPYYIVPEQLESYFKDSENVEVKISYSSDRRKQKYIAKITN